MESLIPPAYPLRAVKQLADSVLRDLDAVSVDFHGEKRTNETHASTTDPEAARRSWPSPFTSSWRTATACALDISVVRATGMAERGQAVVMIGRLRERRIRVRTLAADKGYDARELVVRLRGLDVTPHIARNQSARRSSAIDGRTTRHAGIEYYGGGTSFMSLSDADGVILKGSAVGAAAKPAYGDDPVSQVEANRNECRGDEAVDPEWGTTTVRVCIPGEIGDCGPGIVCFLPSFGGEHVGADSAFSTPGTIATVRSQAVGTDVDAQISAPEVYAGEASFEIADVTPDPDSCLASFQPTSGTASWAFDAEPAWSEERPEQLPY